MKQISLFITLVLLAFAITSCSTPEQKNDTSVTSTITEDNLTPLGQAAVSDDVSSKNILQIAIGSKDHSTLVAAVQAAGIEHVLANNGPLTVFAPVNSAFDALPAGTVENLLKPENKSALSRVLTYHAAPGTYKGKLLKDGMNLYMATGDNVKIEIKDGQVTANGANIIATIDASNGVIHVTDAVLLPPDKK